MNTYLMAATIIAATLLGGASAATAGGRTDVGGYGHDLSLDVDQQGSNDLQAKVFGSGSYAMRMCGDGRRMQVIGVGGGKAIELDQCGHGGRDTLVISDPWGARTVER